MSSDREVIPHGDPHVVTYHPPSVREQAARDAPQVARNEFAWIVNSVVEAGNTPTEWGTARVVNNDGTTFQTSKK